MITRGNWKEKIESGVGKILHHIIGETLYNILQQITVTIPVYLQI